MKKLCVLVLVAALWTGVTGCATRHMSEAPDGSRLAWEGQKDEMLQVIYESFVEVFPGRDIFPQGSNGYYTWQRFAIDKHTHWAVLVPYRSAQGKEACALEVRSEGTILNGPSKNKQLFERIVRRFDAKFKRVDRQQ